MPIFHDKKRVVAELFFSIGFVAKGLVCGYVSFIVIGYGLSCQNETLIRSRYVTETVTDKR